MSVISILLSLRMGAMTFNGMGVDKSFKRLVDAKVTMKEHIIWEVQVGKNDKRFDVVDD